MEKVIKTFVSQIKTINEKDFTLEAVVSDETIDRYGEVIKIDAWKKRIGNYKRHPVLVTSHSYDKLTNQIGYADKVYVKDGELICKFKYFAGEGNPEADWGWKLASKFGQAAYSVGFLPFDYERAEEKDFEEAKMGKKPFLTYTDVELLEVSQVLIPANPSALAKSFEDESDLVVKEYVETMMTRICEPSYEKMIAEDLNIKDSMEIVTKPETTENYHRVPAPGEEGKHSDHKIRTITVSSKQGIKGLYCVDCKKIMTYLFDVDKWSMDEAKTWVEEHSKDFDEVICASIEPCKCHEEEEMDKEAIIGEIKSYIDQKFEKVDKFIEKWDEDDRVLEEIAKELQEEVNSLEEEGHTAEEDETNYLKQLIEDANSIIQKHVVPVQSQNDD